MKEVFMLDKVAHSNESDELKNTKFTLEINEDGSLSFKKMITNETIMTFEAGYQKLAIPRGFIIDTKDGSKRYIIEHIGYVG